MARQPKAKTAYELLERVCAHILEEPKRYYQNDWCWRGERAIRRKWNAIVRVSRERDPESSVEPVPPPQCGTVGCRAGWIVLLHDGMDTRTRNFAKRANEILGTSMWETSYLFDGEDYGQPGTKSYARKGVAGLRAFMKQHAAQLKARSLKGV